MEKILDKFLKPFVEKQSMKMFLKESVEDFLKRISGGLFNVIHATNSESIHGSFSKKAIGEISETILQRNP